jgi:RNA polymerase sigma-70 factor (ECF subfamily)
MAENDSTVDWSKATASGHSTSASLLQRVKAREPEAWQAFVRLYGPLVYRWCRRAGLQAADAADVAQDVFRTVAAKVSEFHSDRAGGSFRGWLYAITRNKLGNHFGRLKGRPQAKGGTPAQQQMLAVPIPASSPPESEEAVDLHLLSHRALAQIRGEFEDRTWQAFWRVTAEGHAPADVAHDLGMTLAAVYKAKSRVLCRLRRQLDGLPT